jgi:hypothetical protein
VFLFARVTKDNIKVIRFIIDDQNRWFVHGYYCGDTKKWGSGDLMDSDEVDRNGNSRIFIDQNPKVELQCEALQLSFGFWFCRNIMRVFSENLTAFE